MEGDDIKVIIQVDNQDHSQDDNQDDDDINPASNQHDDKIENDDQNKAATPNDDITPHSFTRNCSRSLRITPCP